MTLLTKHARMPAALAGLAAGLALIAGLAVFRPSGADAAGVSLKPIADAYVDSSAPTLNTGSQSQLRTDNSPAVRTFLRFDLRNIAGTISSARLQIYANSASTGGLSAVRTNGVNWSETSVDWADAPGLGSTLSSVASVASASTVTLDVTRAIRAGSLVDLAVVTPGVTAISLGSRESSHPPVLVVTTLSAASAPASGRSPAALPSASAPASGDPVLIGAGDICVTSTMANAAATARLIEAHPSAHVFTLGDNSNEAGTASQYTDCYGKTWGAFLGRTRPTIGNHDCGTSNCAPYYAYFGAAAGRAGKGYYSYNLPNNWHVIVLNSQGSEVGGVGFGSPQETWLKADLAAHQGSHVIAMWHIPVLTSGQLYRTAYLPFWQDLYAAHADIIMSGHDHIYERTTLMNPSGKADPNGIREFTVGTGGAPPQPFGTILPTSQVRQSGTFGVLMLTLHAHSYDWRFLPVAGKTWTDSGSQPTHS